MQPAGSRMAGREKRSASGGARDTGERKKPINRTAGDRSVETSIALFIPISHDSRTVGADSFRMLGFVPGTKVRACAQPRLTSGLRRSR